MSCRSLSQVLEARELADEGEPDDAGRSVALLADDQLRHSLAVGRRLALVRVQILPVDEEDHIGILLEGAGLEIGRAQSELQSQSNLVCRLLLEKKKK